MEEKLKLVKCKHKASNLVMIRLALGLARHLLGLGYWLEIHRVKLVVGSSIKICTDMSTGIRSASVVVGIEIMLS